MNTKEREAEKVKRQSRDAEYKEICRQSLENDKKTVTKTRKDRKTVENEKDITIPSATSTPHITASDKLTRKKLALFESALPPVCQTPPGDEEEDDVLEEIPVGEGVPWHHSQLYRMYGKKADYFLHPKLEPQAKRAPNPNLKRYGGSSGANALWETLREESMARLIAEDKNVPQELKAAYSAFVRQSMRLNKKPVKRNYYAQDDVPEMDRLLDQSQVRRVRTFQHKTDLMFRASQSNKDRTDVLLYNNPLPEVVNKSTEESIEQYLPSWSDNISEESRPEYQKWLRPQLTAGGDADVIEEEAEPQTVVSHDTFDTELMQMVARRKPTSKPKYIFLTEKKATCKGQFTERFREKREGRGQRPVVSMSAMSMSESTVTPDLELPTCKSAPLPASRDLILSQYTSEWQPLSMKALVEYKTRIEAPGEGDFNLGRPKMFSFAAVS